jgi:hypothetical protein
MDIERTKHNFWFLHCRFLGQVIHPSNVRCRLLVTTLPLGSLLVDLLRAIVRQVTLFPTSETLVGGIGSTGLHWSIIERTLTLRLIPTLLRRALVTILWLEWGTLRELIVERDLTTIPLTRRRPLLITLLETSTQTSVTTRSLSLKPFPLGIHLLALVIHHDSVVHKRLKVGISIRHQLQL